MESPTAFQVLTSKFFLLALVKEFARFVAAIAGGILLAYLIRYWAGWSWTTETVLATAVGVVGIAAAWLVSAVRTIRAVLREHHILKG